MFGGAALGLAPVYIWLISAGAPSSYLPLHFIWNVLPIKGSGIAGGDYVSKSREEAGLAEQAPRVLRYYLVLILPVALALVSIVLRIARAGIGRFAKAVKINARPYDRFVLLFSVWWLLDMAFVWISPRSYEQYYLPLNASAAILGGYAVALFRDAWVRSDNKLKWNLIGAAAIACMAAMSWHIFFGIQSSPHSGQDYGRKRRGYVQKFHEIRQRTKGAKAPWEAVGEYIRANSEPDDGIYVWGWYPGIYVKAQRLSPAPKAFTSEMHTMSPEKLSDLVSRLFSEFHKHPPKFIVDTHKRHFPWDRPPLELWPTYNESFMPPDNPTVKRQYNQSYSKFLEKQVGAEESQRFKAMQPLREYIMQNYEIARTFGNQLATSQVVFKRKGPGSNGN